MSGRGIGRREVKFSLATALCLFTLTCLISCKVPDGAAKRGDPRADALDALLTGLVSAGEPGAAVLVVEKGRTVFERGYGVAELRTGRPIAARTNFRLASVSKAFTAAAVMLLVRDGKLRYEDRLTDLLPGFPAYGREVTVRHLLQHTSGLPDYEDLMPPAAGSDAGELVQIDDAGVLDLLMRSDAPLFPAGEQWRYSNSGYVVLGSIAAKISGSGYPDLVKRRIFDPLGMSGTLAYVRGYNEVPDRAFGHGRSGGVWRETDQSPTSATLGDGGIYSSVEDMVRWETALRTSSLIPEADMRAALEPVRVPGAQPVEPDGSPAAYGFGWFLNPWKGHPRMWHYGETRGFRTAIERFPERGLTVIVLANRSDIDAAALALKAAGIYLPE